jgi:hypothetical protein
LGHLEVCGRDNIQRNLKNWKLERLDSASSGKGVTKHAMNHEIP